MTRHQMNEELGRGLSRRSKALSVET